jgi:hypothetical protein
MLGLISLGYFLVNYRFLIIVLQYNQKSRQTINTININNLEGNAIKGKIFIDIFW